MAGPPPTPLVSLKGIVAAFRLILDQLDVDVEATTIRVRAVGSEPRVFAAIPVAELLRQADAAIAAAEREAA